MTAIFAFSYAISFAAIAAVIVHTILFHGRISIDDYNHSHRYTSVMQVKQ
jgi:hypothetical protein